MSHPLKRMIETLIATIGISHTLVILMTSAACLGSLAGIAVIKTDKNLNPHQSQLHRVMLYVIGLSLPTLSATGMSVMTMSVITQRIALEESRYSEQETIKYFPQPSPCKGCQHFHGVIYNNVPLICAMHPHGIEGKQCPDWERKP